MTNRGLYIHIPFCIRKCGYCDFYSVANDTELAHNYITAACNEIAAVARRFSDTVVDTVYIGGGTPSILKLSELARLTDAVYKNFSTDIKEFSIEVNPCSAGDLASYRALGINRVSLGVQSANDKILKLIGRLHNADEAKRALEVAASNFGEVSADVMLGLPTQTLDDVREAVEFVMPYVNHISQYMLKLDGGVPMQKAVERGALVLPDDDSTVDMYDLGYAAMANKGFLRYEISNFCLSGHECKHNLKYWNRDEYIGIGAAAYSFIDGVRYDNGASIAAYTAGENLGNGKANVVTLTADDALFEYIMLRFRLPQGIEVAKINRLFNIDFLRDYAAPIAKLNGVLAQDKGYIFIKEDKMLLESLVAVEFLK